MTMDELASTIYSVNFALVGQLQCVNLRMLKEKIA